MTRKNKESKKTINSKTLGNCDNGVCPIDKHKKNNDSKSNQSLQLAIQSWNHVISECEAIASKSNG